MGFKLTDETIEGLQRVFHKETVDKIARTLEGVSQKDGARVQTSVNTNFLDFAGVMKEVTFVFDIGREVLPLEPLELNKWLPIEKINSHVLERNIIFKNKYEELTLHNVGAIDKDDNTVFCNIDNTWYSLEDITHFMIFKQ